MHDAGVLPRREMRLLPETVVDPIGRTGASACYRSALPDGYVDDAEIAFLIAVLGKVLPE